MDLKMMRPAPSARHPGPFVHCCRPRSNDSTSPGRKNSRTHCRDSALDGLFRNPGSYCASSTSGINSSAVVCGRRYAPTREVLVMILRTLALLVGWLLLEPSGCCYAEVLENYADA